LSAGIYNYLLANSASSNREEVNQSVSVT
jgi:hypothetical protein